MTLSFKGFKGCITVTWCNCLNLLYWWCCSTICLYIYLVITSLILMILERKNPKTPKLIVLIFYDNSDTHPYNNIAISILKDLVKNTVILDCVHDTLPFIQTCFTVFNTFFHLHVLPLYIFKQGRKLSLHFIFSTVCLKCLWQLKRGFDLTEHLASFNLAPENIEIYTMCLHSAWREQDMVPYILVWYTCPALF